MPTLFDKLWADHVVVPETADTPAVLYIDLHIIHEVTSPQAFALLREKNLPVRRPDLTLATQTSIAPASDADLVRQAVGRPRRRRPLRCSERKISPFAGPT